MDWLATIWSTSGGVLEKDDNQHSNIPSLQPPWHRLIVRVCVEKGWLESFSAIGEPNEYVEFSVEEIDLEFHADKQQ
jgi:hypothetical protein